MPDAFDGLASSILGDGPPANTGQDKERAFEQHWVVDPNTKAVKLHKKDFNETFTEPPATGPDSADHPYNETISIPPLRQVPMTCGDKCAEQDRLARQHCDMIRKRVAQWMKDSGCPSSIRGFKMKTKCGRSVAATSSCSTGACGLR